MPTAEQLLNLSERAMIGQPLDAILPPPDDPRPRATGTASRVYDTEIDAPRGGEIARRFRRGADRRSSRLADDHAPRTRRTSRRLGHAADRAPAARAAVGAAAMLAHEIKNPLSGIRGAAQLLGERRRGPAS